MIEISMEGNMEVNNDWSVMRRKFRNRVNIAVEVKILVKTRSVVKADLGPKRVGVGGAGMSSPGSLTKFSTFIPGKIIHFAEIFTFSNDSSFSP
ncbi:hypothetical protein CEXT_530651 [Caerostris extrusa]|uniref:Uncharacterized protein n=1 Tax=Caerostris extrusa TaxID=172846 RepID=A0AAV4N7D4_CAEEX|nr:hypothetical protein CEXT_530651 [Caerostris extrusa]